MSRILSAAMIAALILAALSGHASATSSDARGTLEMQLGNQCTTPLTANADFALYGYRVDGPGKFVLQRTAPAAHFRDRTFRLVVPAGAYHYSVSLLPHGYRGIGMGGERWGCVFNFYIVVMPGDVRFQRVPLTDGISDPWTPVLIAGLKPSKVSVSLLLDPGDTPCGSAVNATTLIKSPLLETTSRAYYIDDGTWMNITPSVSIDIAYLLRIVRKDGSSRLLRVRMRRPSERISGNPGFARVDVTSRLLSRLFASGTQQATVMC